MNTADQSLFPIDTAFKRRWAMHYVRISEDDGPVVAVPLTAHDREGVPWRRFFTVINRHIVNHTQSDDKDKQMGPWFINVPYGRMIEAESFCSKVLHYLWNDVFRLGVREVFRPELRTYDELVRDFRNDEAVFAGEVLKELRLRRTDEAGEPQTLASVDGEEPGSQ
jgi:hypothetical protein